MRDNTEPPRRMQVSLRTYLIAVLAAGLTLGVMGQLLRSRPEIFLAVLYAGSTILPFLLAIGTVIWVGLHRSPTWSLPACANCGRDLRWLDLNQVTVCPQCQADLAAPKAVAFRRKQYRSGRMIAWGVVLLLMPVVGIGGAMLVRIAAGPSSQALGLLSTQELLQKRLVAQVDEPWIWRELEQRIAAGKLTQQDVDDAVNILIAHMKATAPGGWSQPFHWQGGFLQAASSAGMISDPVLLDLCDAYYGTKATLQPLPRVREDSGSFNVELDYGSPWNGQFEAGVTLVWEVASIRFGDKKLTFRETHKGNQDWHGLCEGPLPRGERDLVIELDCAYIDANQLAGLNVNNLPAKNWPKARKRWKQTLSTKLTVHTRDEAILKLVTDPDRAPDRPGDIKIGRFVVQNDRNGKKLVCLTVDFKKTLAVPVSFNVSAKVADREVRLGSVLFALTTGGSIESTGTREARLDALDPSVQTADITFTPNPGGIEYNPEVEEIWGETIVLRNVPLERLDLDREKED